MAGERSFVGVPMDTIFALASARGKAGVAVVRVSGTLAWDAVRSLAGSLPKPRQAGLRRLSDASCGQIDDALIICFEEGASFTGEKVAELHLHGSVATISAVLQSLGAIDGLRLATPGEFTRRALENDCLNLTQVEGLGDLIDAETEAQRKQALRVLRGAIGERAEKWRNQLIRAAALLEATIDFVDDEVPTDVNPEVKALLQDVLVDLDEEIEGSYLSERIRDGFEVAIVGAPNVGKSTLLNRLAGRDAAITSEIAGTTRDVVEVRMDLGGLPVTFLDTAGLRETEDAIEGLGIERAVARAKGADLRIFLVEKSMEEVFHVDRRPQDILVRGKADLYRGISGLAVSGKTGQGIELLVEKVSQVFRDVAVNAGVTLNARHRESMKNASGSISKALNTLLENQIGTELIVDDIRQALRQLDSLIGRVDVEHILDELFSRFCLGK